MKTPLVIAALLVSSAAAAAPCRRPTLHIDKERGRLTVRCGEQVLHSFAATFGAVPFGPKRRRADGRTPEGSYMVCSQARYLPLHLFLNLSYPNRADADRALARGQIGPGQHRRIIAALRRNRCPRGITPLGSGVGIHGTARPWARLIAVWQQLSRIGGIHRYIGLTNGCILLANADLDRLWPLVESGETHVEIEGRDPRSLWDRLSGWSNPRSLPLVGRILRLLEPDDLLAQRPGASDAISD